LQDDHKNLARQQRMNFRTMLDTLSRSSAQAVRTLDNTQ
jgi:hypothetical protein